MPSEASFYHNMKVGEVIRYSANLRGLGCKYGSKKAMQQARVGHKRKKISLAVRNVQRTFAFQP